MKLESFFKIIVVCTLLGSSLPSMAALRNGMYVGLTAGGSVMRSKVNKKMEHDTSFVSTLAFGGRFGSIRGAVELMMNTKADYETDKGNISYEANGISFQTYYDVPLRSMIRPFFNLGAGMYGSNIKGDPDISDKNNKMMWNVGGGLTLAVSRATSLDLGYRYLRFSKEKYKDGNGKMVPIESEAHQIYAGYRYVF